MPNFLDNRRDPTCRGHARLIEGLGVTARSATLGTLRRCLLRPFQVLPLLPRADPLLQLLRLVRMQGSCVPEASWRLPTQ